MAEEGFRASKDDILNERVAKIRAENAERRKEESMQERKDRTKALILYAEYEIKKRLEKNPRYFEEITIIDPKTKKDYTGALYKEVERIKGLETFESYLRRR